MPVADGTTVFQPQLNRSRSAAPPAFIPRSFNSIFLCHQSRRHPLAPDLPGQAVSRNVTPVAEINAIRGKFRLLLSAYHYFHRNRTAEVAISPTPGQAVSTLLSTLYIILRRQTRKRRQPRAPALVCSDSHSAVPGKAPSAITERCVGALKSRIVANLTVFVSHCQP